MKIDPKHLAFGFAVLMLALALAACTGIDIGDVVHVRTPHEIQQTRGLPGRMTLNEAEAEYQAWFDDVQRAGAQWKAAIERGGEIRGLLGQLTLSALDEVGPTLAGVPVLGPSLPALTGLVGLFVGAGRLRKEKEASYNRGLETGRTMAVATASQGSVMS